MSACSNQHAVYLDVGTTNTRVWLACGDDIVVHTRKPVGVRIAAREGSTESIANALRDLIAEVVSQAGQAHHPDCIAAAGMISSGLGVKEIPHVQAPAGLAEIVAASQWNHFPGISDLPFLLVPGIRTVDRNGATEDVMRGEETLCLGLIGCDLLSLPAMVLNLGSHWKAIELDSAGRICSSITSLSGELIDAVRTQTVLASSLPQQFPEELAWNWAESAMTECRLTGLPRTLFRARLLELDKEGTAEERLAFVVGAFIASDLEALMARGMLENKPVFLNGQRAIADCWQRALEQKLIAASVLTAHDTERGFVKGLQQVVKALRTERFKAVLA